MISDEFFGLPVHFLGEIQFNSIQNKGIETESFENLKRSVQVCCPSIASCYVNLDFF